MMENPKKAYLPRRVRAGKTIHQKELLQVREICSNLKKLSSTQHDEVVCRRAIDYINLKEITTNSKQDNEMVILQSEVAMSILNLSQRKNSLRKCVLNRMVDEKELNNAMQNHKDEFTRFIWTRRFDLKRDMRSLFQLGPGIIGRFGDLLAEASSETINSFVRSNCSLLCKDAIASGYCEAEDIPSFFQQTITISLPHIESGILVSASRLDFVLKEGTNIYYRVFASGSIWASKLYGKFLNRKILNQTIENIKEYEGSGNKDQEYSFVPLIARTLDLLHPSHQLQATVLAFPLYSVQILKRRVLSLHYDLPPGGEDSPFLDSKLALDILNQMEARIDTEMKVYFEFTVPYKLDWIVGFTISNRVTITKYKGFPGDDRFGFGIVADGTLRWEGAEYPFTSSFKNQATFNGNKILGILTDLYRGSIQIVCSDNLILTAFGRGASHFTEEQQIQQRKMITKQQITPTFALLYTGSLAPIEKCQMSTNFGQRKFQFNLKAQGLAAFVPTTPTRGFENINILENTNATEKINQDEDEKINAGLEKNYFRLWLLPNLPKSFSQFPPSIYRRSLAATRIQRVWRIHRGRLIRMAIKKEQYNAACVIQKMVREKLRKIREIKNDAAFKIQRCWRRKLFIRAALLRCIYRSQISHLHQAAIIIQKKWRHWSRFRNSPLASKYQVKMEDLEKAAQKIISWWKPLYLRLKEIRKQRELLKAAITIQKLHRGASLRSKLRPELRTKLVTIGRIAAAARNSLSRLCAALTIQRYWRKYIRKKIRNNKLMARHRASVKIQAAWKGFWVRAHNSIRFTYGEMVFLLAVRRNLIACHFILKMYRPCGIVCPKKDK